jgi:hypothetical protein
LVALLGVTLSAATLRPKTVQAFDDYMREAERRIAARVSGARAFLWLDEDPARQSAARSGEVVVESIGPDDGLTKVPDGLVHDWIAGAFLPNVTIEQVLEFVQDYDKHQEAYYPDVVESRLESRDGNRFRIFYRLRNKAFFTVELNTEHDARFHRLDERRWHSRSYATRIAQIDNAGKPDEKEMPVGEDGGYLWRLNSFWRYAERDGGVWIECEAITLSRSFPPVLGTFIRPIAKKLARSSLTKTLTHTRNGVMNPRSTARNLQ